MPQDMADIYIALLKKPSSHLELSRNTGVNRTKVYRLVQELEKRSLVSTIADDAGTRIEAADPKHLELSVAESEQKLQTKRDAYTALLPQLSALKSSAGIQPTDFIVRTYDGEEGFKQMLWNELKAKREVLVFGSGPLEKLVSSNRWTENHRQKSIDAGYRIRELLNPGKKPPNFTKNDRFKDIYQVRFIDSQEVPLQHQIAIYNDTVSIYHWRDDQKVGSETINRAYADTMRSFFEHYWAKGKDTYKAP